MIDFSQAVDPRFRAGIEQAIKIKSSKPVVGAWYWDNQCGTAECLYFRTRNYWPQHTKVSFDAHFNGAEIAPGVYGTTNLSQSFTIGNSLIGVTSTVTHHTRIYWKGKYYQTWTDSSGQPGDDTADGTYLTIEKANPTLMTGPGYKNVPVYWAVRFTWSGNYYHDAPWSLGEQGFTNVSHGCVNLSPPARPVVLPAVRPGRPDHHHRQPGRGQVGRRLHRVVPHLEAAAASGSATHEAVQVGPTGSTFVNPDTLPAAPSSSVLDRVQARQLLRRRPRLRDRPG